MDLIYMSDAIAYHSIRGPSYENYDYQLSNVNQGKAEKSMGQDVHISGDKCKICKEKQRRALASYIRSKSIDSSEKNKIVEEEEEGVCS